MRASVRLCLIPFFLLPVAAASAAPPAIETHQCVRKGGGISEERYVSIGGIEQWMTIRGANCANPVVLIVHGGPGNPMTPYAQKLYGAWEKDFTLVQWDQRGAGRTFGRNKGSADETLTVEGMAKDGVEVAQYAASRLGKQKVILKGGSWGSVLAVHMAKMRPDMFAAYVGTSQLVSSGGNGLASYTKLLERARAAGDSKTVAAIEALGPPPWKNPRNFGILRRATRLYEGKVTDAAPTAWWERAPEYATAPAAAEYEAGEDYSFIQFVGMEGNGMLSTIDLRKLGTRFDIPVYLIQGAEDLVTTKEVTKAWYDSIAAPHKDYILLERVGHDPNTAMVDAQYKVLKDIGAR
jgi:pimeloyl-ACP methyl ester carboxylesterase